VGERAQEDEDADARDGASGRTIWKLVGAGVAALALIVWLSLPNARPPDAPATDDASAPAVEPADATFAEPVPRPTQASVELGVLVEEGARELASAEIAARKLSPRYCGDVCARVGQLVRQPDAFSLTTMPADDWGLPEREARAAMAPTLTSAELASIDRRPLVLVIRAHGQGAPDHLPARAAFAVAAALADATGGLVYDEVVRRIENAETFRRHVITAPLGAPVLRADHFAVQLYPHGEGTARMVSLGLGHFGCADLVMQGLRPESGPVLGGVLDAVAGELARGAVTSPIDVGGPEIARVLGTTVEALGARPGARARVTLIEAERVAGDPDNPIAEIVPPAGSTPEGHDAVLTLLFGAAPDAAAPDAAGADER
jgi:hypothetical protein